MMTHPRTSNCYFITGTDTGVGKTVVAAALMAGLHAAGKKVLYHKPVQTGCRDDVIDDTTRVMQLAGLTTDQILPPQHHLALPASPDCAARYEGVKISFANLVSAILAAAATVDACVVEGAGGLLVPVDATHTMLDLLIALSAKPVIVTRSALGTINHTALTLEALTRKGLRPAALVINETQPLPTGDHALVREDNLAMLKKMAAPVPCIVLPYTQTFAHNDIVHAGQQLVQSTGA